MPALFDKTLGRVTLTLGTAIAFLKRKASRRGWSSLSGHSVP